MSCPSTANVLGRAVPCETICSAPVSNEYSNPGKDAASPEDINRYLTVDKERAFSNINAFWVVEQKLTQRYTILDISCGPGYSTSVFADLAHQDSIIVGVDRRTDNVEFATAHYGKEYSNLSYSVLQSPYYLPDSPDREGWQRVSALAFFSWIPLDEHLPVLENIFSCMADAGELLVRTTAVGDRPYREAATAVSKKEEWKSYFVDYQSPSADQTAEGFSEALVEAGFSEVQTSSRVDRFYFSTKIGMVNYFLQWLPELSEITGRTPAETDLLRRQFTQEVIDEYCALIHSNGEDIYLDFPAVYATAVAKKIDLLAMKSTSLLC